jgi:predicted HTH transcriptional regulator
MVSWAELGELLREGENSGVEFKGDGVRPQDVAKELVALSNLRGGSGSQPEFVAGEESLTVVLRRFPE